MISTVTILQCGVCLRQHDGAGNLLPLRFCVPEDQVCGRPDCAEVAERRERAEVVKKQFKRNRKFEIRNMKPGQRPGCGAGRELRSSCPPESDRVYDDEPRTQREFEDSGAAADQNAILIKFFLDEKTTGQPFPMPYLEEISGAKRFNNRAIDLRRHFEPLGFGFYNEQRQVNERGPMLSHYTKLPLAEVERLEQERKALRAARREEKAGQKIF
jgi:hypothetical protein